MSNRDSKPKLRGSGYERYTKGASQHLGTGNKNKLNQSKQFSPKPKKDWFSRPPKKGFR